MNRVCHPITSNGGPELFYAEFHADFRSGLHFGLGGRISEHKSFFHFHFQWNDTIFLGLWKFWILIFLNGVFLCLLHTHDHSLIARKFFDNYRYKPQYNDFLPVISIFFSKLRSGFFRSVAEIAEIITSRRNRALWSEVLRLRSQAITGHTASQPKP